ncbi:MAG: 50S ribosomal protein L9 [Gammaproteobacteria bacterium]|nr:50S ribosomal protein L9 [Gammaproteobacteria bacterium]
MDVILLEKIRNLGILGDRVKVKPGYGRNYLIPTGKAVFATDANIKRFEQRRAEFEAQAAETLKSAQEKQAALSAMPAIVIRSKAGDEGKLFGSIGTRDIAAAITEAGISISKSEVILPTGVLRQTGEYDIEVELHGDLSATVKVQIVAEA